ncbi:MAG: cytochrome c peroxidase [Planctomycetota bacterium]
MPGELPKWSELELRRILRLSPMGTAPLDSTNRYDGDPLAEQLGRFLFFDEALSSNGEISCATCHDPSLGLSDGKPVAETLGLGPRRTPALWNQAYGHWFFHDGRADTLWSQALGPLENEIEMGSDRLAVLHRIAGEPELLASFEALCGPLPELEDKARFPEHARPIPSKPDHALSRAWLGMKEEDRIAVNHSFSKVGKLLAAFERQLVSQDSAFDRFVVGLREEDPVKQEALSPSAGRGLRLFLGKGNCRLCHNGPNFSDGEFHGLGLASRAGGMPTDSGRYEGVPQVLAGEFNATSLYSDDPSGERAQQLTGLSVGPANWGEFKTPSLRNVNSRPPYMHAGQFKDLAAVLNFYSTLEGSAPLHQHQEQILTARNFTSGEMEDLEAFLRSLEGAEIDPSWTRSGPPPPPRSVRKKHPR